MHTDLMTLVLVNLDAGSAASIVTVLVLLSLLYPPPPPPAAVWVLPSQGREGLRMTNTH